MGKRFDEDDDVEVETSFGGEGGEGGGEGGEGSSSASGLSPEDLLKKQQEEQEGVDQHSEDRGDNFEPDDVVDPGKVDGDLLDDMQGILGEGEDEGKEAAAATEEEGKQATKAPIMIPKQRFDEVLGKMRDAVARAENAEAQLKAIQPAETGDAYDFEDAERRYMDALVEEGDREKALAIRKEIREAEQAQLKTQNTTAVHATNTQTTVQDAFQTVVQSAIELYPFLDSTNKEAADFDAIDMVVALRDKYETQGMNPAKALQEAVNKVGPKFSTVAVPAAEEVKQPTEAEKRAAESVQRNAQASRQQPANLARIGEQQGKATVNVTELSEAQFDALPEEEKARLRGDFV